MKQSELLHTWQLSKSSWLWRYYDWLYTPIGQPTFCRLWWGVVLSPFVLLVFGIIGGFMAIWDFFSDRHHAKNLDKADLPPKPKAKKVKTGPSKAEQFVSWVAARFDSLVAFFQSHPGIGMTVRRFMVVLGALIAIGLVADGIWLLIWTAATFTTGFVLVMEWIGSVTGGLILCIGIAALFATTRLSDWLYDAVFTPIGHLFCPFGRFLRGVGRFLYAGYYMVKTRTCPRIEVTE